jgi:hypothetical protein
MTALQIHQFYAGIAPWAALTILLIGRNPHSGIPRKVAALLLAALILILIPINGWNLQAWIRTLEPNPSVTVTALLLVALGSRLSGKAFFRREDWHGTLIFGAVTALVLYPMGLGLTRIDPYAWGWNPMLPLAVTAVATLLLFRGNRFGIVLILPLACSVLGLQESTNFWDTLIDPFYGGVSLILCTGWLVRRVSRLTSPAAVID